MPRFATLPFLCLCLTLVNARLGLFRVNGGQTRRAVEPSQPVDAFEFLVQEDSRSALRYLSSNFDGSMSMLDFSMSVKTQAPTESSTTQREQTTSPGPVGTKAPTPVTESPIGTTLVPTLAPTSLRTTTVPPTVTVVTSSPEATQSPVSSPTAAPSSSPSSDSVAAIQGPSNSGSSNRSRKSRGVLASFILIAMGAVVGLAMLVIVSRRRRRTGGGSVSDEDSDASIGV